MSVHSLLMCDVCGAQYTCAHSVSPQIWARNDGWVRAKDGRDLCPDCVKVLGHD